MTLAKSAKWRSRQKAYEANQLYQWEAEQSARTHANGAQPNSSRSSRTKARCANATAVTLRQLRPHQHA